MKIWLAFIVAIVLTLSAHAKDTPCSGKKGGIKSCTADGLFMCQNGTISQSKQQCTYRKPKHPDNDSQAPTHKTHHDDLFC